MRVHKSDYGFGVVHLIRENEAITRYLEDRVGCPLFTGARYSGEQRHPTIKTLCGLPIVRQEAATLSQSSEITSENWTGPMRCYRCERSLKREERLSRTFQHEAKKGP